MKRFVTPAMLVAVFLCWAIGIRVWAGTTGKIAGRVQDRATGEPLPGANIIVTAVINQGKELPLQPLRGAAANRNGEFVILNLQPGRYILKASMIGYETRTVKNIIVSVDYTTTVDFVLQETALHGEEVVVVAEREQIRPDLTSAAAVVDAGDIEVMPVTEVDEVLSLQAGFVRADNGALHIRGGRASEVSYMIDGVQITDPVNRTAGLVVDNQAIQELQAITGTFNAEYGQALSGVINVVTKSGGERYQGRFQAAFGDYLSFDEIHSVFDDPEWARAAAEALTRDNGVIIYKDEVFTRASTTKPVRRREKYLDNFAPFRNQDLQANLSGPLPFTGKQVTFFASGRYDYDAGYISGKRYFMPWGFHAPLTDTVNTWKLPDNKLVSLNWNRSISFQTKLSFRPLASMRLSYGIYYDDNESRGSSHVFRYVPDAQKKYFTTSITHILSLNHMLSGKVFYELRANIFRKRFKHYLYKNPLDYRLIPSQSADIEQFIFDKNNNPSVQLAGRVNDFAFLGNETDRGYNNVDSYTLKFDLTAQVTPRHQLKLGALGRLHDLEDEWMNLQFNPVTYKAFIPDISSPFHNYWHHKPREFSAYIQDKAEFKEIIFNIGVRFDYFDPDGQVLADPANPQLYNPFNGLDTLYTLAERRSFWFKQATTKSQISPRLGVAFPVSETGVFHFSYGHFFQNPEFQFLYSNPEFEIDGAGAQNLIGNADLNAERSVMYEVGLQQALSDQLHFDLTAFYRDIRDYVGTGSPIDTYKPGAKYIKYINKDFANAQGITLTARFRTRRLFVNIDYTLMKAEGTTSDPTDAYFDLQANRAPRQQMISLDWDRTHTLNSTISYSSGGFLASLIGRIQAGTPYTPAFSRAEVSGASTFSGLAENSERKPALYQFDLRLAQDFKLAGSTLQLFLNVFNLFDTKQVRSVYDDTGRGDFTLNGITQQNRVIEIGDVNEFFARPENFFPPREIQWGVVVMF